jgi:hypothetical protein
MTITHQDIKARIAALDAERESLKELCSGIGHDIQGRFCSVCGHTDMRQMWIGGALGGVRVVKWTAGAHVEVPAYWDEPFTIDIGTAKAEAS